MSDGSGTGGGLIGDAAPLMLASTPVAPNPFPTMKSRVFVPAIKPEFTVKLNGVEYVIVDKGAPFV